MNDENKQPWYNDGDRVSGLVTTMLFLTVCIVICLAIIALSLKVLF